MVDWEGGKMKNRLYTKKLKRVIKMVGDWDIEAKE